MAKKIKVKNSLFNSDTAQDFVDSLKEELTYPFIAARISELGGKENVTIMLAVSIEPKEIWKNGIFENSMYRRFSIENDGTVENFTASDLPKIRKFTAKSVEDIATRLNKY
jgi:hypothetical protein